MPATKSAATDPIYVALVEARDMLINNFNLVRVAYGDDIYNEIFKNVEAEYVSILARIDERIGRRIMELATEDLM